MAGVPPTERVQVSVFPSMATSVPPVPEIVVAANCGTFVTVRVVPELVARGYQPPHRAVLEHPVMWTSVPTGRPDETLVTMVSVFPVRLQVETVNAVLPRAVAPFVIVAVDEHCVAPPKASTANAQ